jgi:hypothetical protein
MVDRNRLALEHHDVEALRIVDQAQAPLRPDRFGDVGDVVGRVGRRDTKAGTPMPSAAIWVASGFE